MPGQPPPLQYTTFHSSGYPTPTPNGIVSVVSRLANKMSSCTITTKQLCSRCAKSAEPYKDLAITGITLLGIFGSIGLGIKIAAAGNPSAGCVIVVGGTVFFLIGGGIFAIKRSLARNAANQPEVSQLMLSEQQSTGTLYGSFNPV